MLKIRIALVLAAVIASQSVFADMAPEGKECGAIAKACLKAGYSRSETQHKKFWTDCMKPVILGQSVKGVKVDADTVTTCRTKKIAEMKSELNDLEAAAPQG